MLTRERWCKKLVGEQLQVLQGDIPDGRNVEQPGEHVGRFGSKNIEQSHATVELGQGSFAPQQLPREHKH